MAYETYLPIQSLLGNISMTKAYSSNSYRYLHTNYTTQVIEVGAGSSALSPQGLTNMVIPSNYHLYEVGAVYNVGDYAYELDTYRVWRYAKDISLTIDASNFDLMHPALIDEDFNIVNIATFVPNKPLPRYNHLNGTGMDYTEEDAVNIFDDIVNNADLEVWLHVQIRVLLSEKGILEKYPIFIDDIDADYMAIYDAYYGITIGLKDSFSVENKTKIYLENLPGIRTNYGYIFRLSKKVNIGIEKPTVDSNGWRNIHGFTITSTGAVSDSSESSTAFQSDYVNYHNYLNLRDKVATDITIIVNVSNYVAGNIYVSFGGNTSSTFNGDGKHIVTIPFNNTDYDVTIIGIDNLDATITSVQMYPNDYQYIIDNMPTFKSINSLNKVTYLGCPLVDNSSNRVSTYSEILSDGVKKEIIEKSFDSFSGDTKVEEINFQKVEHILAKATQGDYVFHMGAIKDGVGNPLFDQRVYLGKIKYKSPIDDNSGQFKINISGQSLAYNVENPMIAPDSTDGFPQ